MKEKPADQRGIGKGRVPPKPRTVAGVLGEVDAALRAGLAKELVPVPTGFEPLDSILGGGLQAGELTLLGGAPGAGKTIACLQWARNIALAGRTVVYACYEHEESELLLRLLSLEIGESSEAPDFETTSLRAGIRAAATSEKGLAAVFEENLPARRAHARVEQYSERLWLLKASGAHTGMTEIDELLDQHIGGSPVLFVDYLQKVSVRPEPASEAEKVTQIAAGLKELALARRVPVVSIVAAEMEGIKSPRLRLHHLRGSSALAFESDVAIILNEKFRCLSKVHLAYDPVRAETFKDWVVFSIEKNRGGPSLIDVEFRKDFAHFRFDSDGGIVVEKLLDERIYVE